MHLDFLFVCVCFCCRPVADSPPDKITVILLLVIHYPQPCGAVFTIKILSHVATAAPIHLMSGFKEQLKALLRQLCVFDVGELDIPTDLEHSPRINTVVWRLTRRALYSLNAEIHTASMKVPGSLSLSLSLSSPHLTLHSFAAFLPPLSLSPFLSLSLPPACFGNFVRSLSICPSSSLCLSSSLFALARLRSRALFDLPLVSVNCMGLITKTHLARWKGV